MYALAAAPIHYAPPSSIAPDVAVGRAFARAWHERSDASSRQLETAIARLVDHLRRERISPEESVIMFKRAVHRFAGLHASPGLALDHHADGDEAALVYAEAFTAFVVAFFEPALNP